MSFDFKKAIKEGIKSARPYTYKLINENHHTDTETEALVLEEGGDKIEEEENE